MIVLAMMVVMAVAAATATFARGVVSQIELVSVERDLGSIENLRLISGSMKIEVSQTHGGARLEAMLDSRRELKVTERGDGVVIEPTRITGIVSSARNEIIRLYLPANIGVEIESGSGSVTVNDIDLEELRIDSGSGSIEVSGTSGPLALSAGSGDIRVTGSDGAVMAESGSGSHDYRDVKGEIVANAESGSIRLDDVTGVLSISAGSGDLAGISVALTGDSSFTTLSGSIDMTFENSEDELSFDLDAGSGEIRVGDTHGANRMIIGTGGIEVRGRSESGDQDYTTR